MSIKVIYGEPDPDTGRVWRTGKCECCGRELDLMSFTNDCECGAEYNSSGQRLAPREQWGEETGEHPSDLGRL